MGCSDEFVLRLQRDGQALLTRPGNGRSGRAEQRLAGQVNPRDFEALARQLLAGGYFDLAPVYEDPQMRDGSTSTLSVETGPASTSVASREGWGPAALLQMLAAADSLRSKIEFKALP